MKDSEELALQYLKSTGLTPIVYEPAGNCPPDFLLGGSIAAEVRRLNFNQTDEAGVPSGIETDQFALLRCFREFLPALGPPVNGRSWFVCFEFSRPLSPLRLIRRKAISSLAAFRDGKTRASHFFISENFQLDLIPSTELFPDLFVMGGFSDNDAGGWLIGELEKNIRICIREKTEKIAPVRSKYPEWWLILIDFVGYGQEETICLPHDWDKVVVVNPLDPTKAHEIKAG